MFTTNLSKIKESIRWRYRSLFNQALYGLAGWHRNRATHPAYIAVTGSVGKTTAKELIAHILAHQLGAGTKTLESWNYPEDLALILLRTRNSHAYCVAELSAHAGPGGLDLPLKLMKPNVGVVTAIGSDHHSAFGNLDAIAAEKFKVIRSLPHDGIAVLNSDDPYVIAMGAQFKGKTVTFGTSENAMVRANSICSAWPERLSLTVTWNEESLPLQTQLYGTLWVPSILAALATGLALGVPLATAVDALANAQSLDGRMTPVEIDGITFLLDDWKAALLSIDPAFEVIRTANAARKVIVVGSISDYPGSDRRYAQIAKAALAIADCVVFVGPFASLALRAKRNSSDNLYSFETTLDAHNFLQRFLKRGDLVLLKGNIRTDHLRRVFLARTMDVKCWRMDCHRANFCDACELIQVPSGTVTPLVQAADADTASTKLAASKAVTIVVGLGNPQARFVNTPHNVGYRAVEAMANVMSQYWSAEGDLALVARGEIENQQIYLVKPLCAMNESGPAIAQLSDRIGFHINQCIVVHDDLELALGTVRARERGSDGGHKGVKSILQTFQTDQIRRIKIGVGKPPDGTTVMDHVVTTFRETDLPKIETATKVVADRILELIRKQQREAVIS